MAKEPYVDYKNAGTEETLTAVFPDGGNVSVKAKGLARLSETFQKILDTARPGTRRTKLFAAIRKYNLEEPA